MAERHRQLFALLACLSIAAASPAAPQQATNWDRVSAMSAARSIDAGPIRDELVSLTLTGNPGLVVERLEAVSGRGDWPLPARERALYTYARALAELPSGSVPARVLDWLKSYRARTLVPDEDRPDIGVPLFDVRRAAFAAENGWRRQDATVEAQALLASNPRSLVDAFILEEHPAARSGYVAALEQASLQQLETVAGDARERLAGEPGLTSLGGEAALLADDLDLLQNFLVAGRGPALALLMRRSASILSAADNARLLAATVAAGSAVNASLAIAELAPAAADEPGTQELLLARLADAGVGGAAALALARCASTETLQALGEVADGDDPLAASRARLALQMHATRGGGHK